MRLTLVQNGYEKIKIIIPGVVYYTEEEDKTFVLSSRHAGSEYRTVLGYLAGD